MAFRAVVTICDPIAIKQISAVTFAVRDIAPAIEFYQKLGCTLIRDDRLASCSSLKSDEAFVKLVANPGAQLSSTRGTWWRTIFLPSR